MFNEPCSIAEPTARIELATLRLQGGRSAAELRRPLTCFAGDNLSPAPTLYHKEQLGQGTVRSYAGINCTRDREGCQRSCFSGKLRKHIALKPRRLHRSSTVRARSNAIAKTVPLWYTPAPRIHADTLIYMPPDRRAVLESTALELPCEMKEADDPKLLKEDQSWLSSQ